jgi:hypothetical protein
MTQRITIGLLEDVELPLDSYPSNSKILIMVGNEINR